MWHLGKRRKDMITVALDSVEDLSKSIEDFKMEKPEANHCFHCLLQLLLLISWWSSAHHLNDEATPTSPRWSKAVLPTHGPSIQHQRWLSSSPPFLGRATLATSENVCTVRHVNLMLWSLSRRPKRSDHLDHIRHEIDVLVSDDVHFWQKSANHALLPYDRLDL